MPTLTRDDGAEIHWEQRGEGPLVIFASYWSGHPSAFENLTKDLVRDHRVVYYDGRGTGGSTRTGPFDMETGAGDLAAVAEAAGGDAVVISMTDAVNRAVRVADADPELVRAVVAPGSAPLHRDALKHTDSLLASDNVVEAFMETMASSYRGALQAMMARANPQMDEEEVQRRIDLQADYVPQETAVGLIRAWADDDAGEPARRIGDRLWILFSEDVAGPWFPSGEVTLEIFGRLLPDARMVEIADGIVSRPDQTSEVIRKITAGIQSSA